MSKSRNKPNNDFDVNAFFNDLDHAISKSDKSEAEIKAKSEEAIKSVEDIISQAKGRDSSAEKTKQNQSSQKLFNQESVPVDKDFNSSKNNLSPKKGK